MFNHSTKILSALFVILFGHTSHALACPVIGPIPDYNCDGQLIISVIGDSFVSGVGDNTGLGYVGRTQNNVTNIEFRNLGTAGLKVSTLTSNLKKRFATQPNFKAALIQADVVVLDLGRNDRWAFGTPKATYLQLQKIAKNIQTLTKNSGVVSPVVVTAALMLPNRGSQGPWVKELNTLILAGGTTTNPHDLRFDLVSKRLLTADQIHPTAAGHTALAATFQKYIKGKLAKRLAKLRPDLNNNGTYDFFE